jgi:hypothetical protein
MVKKEGFTKQISSGREEFFDLLPPLEGITSAKKARILNNMLCNYLIVKKLCVGG